MAKPVFDFAAGKLGFRDAPFFIFIGYPQSVSIYEHKTTWLDIDPLGNVFNEGIKVFKRLRSHFYGWIKYARFFASISSLPIWFVKLQFLRVGFSWKDGEDDVSGIDRQFFSHGFGPLMRHSKFSHNFIYCMFIIRCFWCK